MTSDTLEPGVVLGGKYRIERTLGEGGMAIVLLAEHLKLGHRVAIKALRPELAANADIVARFEREGRALCRIRSRHVVRALDVESTPGGAPLLIMEYLEGCDLEEELRRRGVLPIAEVIEWMMQACGAMQEVHEQGLVHRDLKPTNLFLTTEGATRIVKVLDFGIAGDALAAGDGRLTRNEALLGTPYYMAPEQFRALRDVDARADVWALGATLYELLTGTPPFTGAATTVGISVVSEDVRPIEALRPDVPPDLRAAVLRALEKDRSRRTQTMKALADDLRPFADQLILVTRSSLHSVPDAGKVASAKTLAGDTLALTTPIEASRPRAISTTGAVTQESTPPRTQRSRASLGIGLGIAGMLAAGAGAIFFLTRSPAVRPVSPTLPATVAPAASASEAIPPPIVSAATPVAPAPSTVDAPPAPSARPRHSPPSRPSPPSTPAKTSPATTASAPSGHPLFFPR